MFFRKISYFYNYNNRAIWPFNASYLLMSYGTIYFAGGCFWGTEHFFKGVDGVVSTMPGYANGTLDKPSYEQVYTDSTGHAETVQVIYDPARVPLGKLVRLFFASIDPLALNRQGHDVGTRYRTGVYYTDEKDLPVIEEVFAEQQKLLDAPLAVEKGPLKNFCVPGMNCYS